MGGKGWSAIYNPGAVTVGQKISYLFSMIFLLKKVAAA